MSSAAHATIPGGIRARYIPCMEEEAKALLEEYDDSGDPDIADHLIESLDATSWGLSAGYQPRPQVVDRGTTARYGGQLRYI